jgi:hypothetical protein
VEIAIQSDRSRVGTIGTTPPPSPIRELDAGVNARHIGIQRTTER